MIFPMPNSSESSSSLWQRYRGGESDARSTVASVFLALVLVCTLLGAQGLVYSRSGLLLAAQNGEKVIREVSRQGLERFLPDMPATDIYRYEQEGSFIGFSVNGVSRNETNGHIRGSAYTHLYTAQGHSKITISSDLSQYVLSEVIEATGRGVLERNEVINVDGLIQGRKTADRLDYRVFPYSSGRFNIVPRFFFDIFVALAVQKDFAKGVALSIISDDLYPRGQLIRFQEQECLIEPLDVFPASVPGFDPIVLGAKVQWLAPDTGLGLKDYDILEEAFFFDAQGRLLRQFTQYANGESILGVRTTLEQMQHTHPDAAADIEEWLDEWSKDEERIVL